MGKVKWRFVVKRCARTAIVTSEYGEGNALLMQGIQTAVVSSLQVSPSCALMEASFGSSGIR